jgi:3D (Asp-Asp-Asp) domain-containing protein
MNKRIKNALLLIVATILIGLAYGLILSMAWMLIWGAPTEVIEPAAGAGRITPATKVETPLAEIAPIEDVPETTEAPEATEPAPQSLGTFKLTAYCSCPLCCGEWADGTTYTGTTATAGRTIAVDPDVIPLGSTVYINGAPFVAEDIGGAIQGNRIDVYFPTHDAAIEFGVQYAEISIN